VDGDDFNEPIADAVRSILDGHIVLSRTLAAKNHFPAIDILQSISRLMTELVDEEQQQLAAVFRDYLAVYTESEDLISIGAYVEGTNPRLDQARQHIDEMRALLKQGINEVDTYAAAREKLRQLLGKES